MRGVLELLINAEQESRFRNLKLSIWFLTFVMLNSFMYMCYTSPQFDPVYLLHFSYKHVFNSRVENIVDLDQLASLEASWSRYVTFQKKKVKFWFGKTMVKIHMKHKWAATWDFQQCDICDQQSLRSAWAYAQSDPSLCLSLEYPMNVKLLTEHHFRFLSLHLSKWHIVVNHVSRLKCKISVL